MKKYVKWYKHQTEAITKAKDSTILCDFALKVDRKIKSNRRKIVVKDYLKNTGFLIDMSIIIIIMLCG